MALSRLQASLAAVTNEVTVAAANINFDFTLVRCEAPKEYQALGRNLSRLRKEDAETGTIHVTARRLGALFDGVCPSTPHLVKAYGTRVSEISEASKEIFDATQAENSIFAAHAGVDGASIWAAATSSTAAIHVQLLACMLARMWSGPEATSAWVELVEERKKTIASQFEAGEQIPFSTVTAAAQLDIPRSQLANWDASARAWLRTADNVKSHEQKQLLSILDKVNVMVSQDQQVFTSVTSTWISALESMEKLVSGMPQAINGGSTLLALGAWYLYPDILLVGSVISEYCLQDPLIAPGGTLTVGLAKSDDHKGVYWSLSLAHLRYYGLPVLTQRELSSDSARVSFDQSTQVVFGMLLGAWDVPEANINLVARFLVAVENVLEGSFPAMVASQDDSSNQAKFESEDVDSTSIEMDVDSNVDENTRLLNYREDRSHWLHMMANAARACLDEDEEEALIARKLIRKGLRSTAWCEANTSVQWPFFNFSKQAVLDRCLDSVESQIAFFRNYVATRFDKHCDLIIRYCNPEDKTTAQFATVFPCHKKSLQRKRLPPRGTDSLLHHRWLERSQRPRSISPDLLIPPDEGFTWRTTDDFHMPGSLDSGRSVDIRNSSGVWKRYRLCLGSLETVAVLSVVKFGELTPSKEHGNGDNGFKTGSYAQLPDGKTQLHITDLSIMDMLWCLETGQLSPRVLMSHIEQSIDHNSPIILTLKALSVMSKIYKLLPGTTIAISAINWSLHRAKWASSMYLGTVDRTRLVFDLSLLDRKVALSCVAYLESGHCNIEPQQLTDVFALSTGDSLYVAMPLLCDPYEVPRGFELKRILGNIGRAGITMLISPKYPVLRTPDPSAWRLISTASFDGQETDCFNHTTLHLSFTEYNRPMYDVVHRGEDSPVFVLESVVSIHDRGAWVGDINVLPMFEASHIVRLPVLPGCNHQKGLRPDSDFISVESWDEILELPKQSSIIRASGNWIARLAIITVVNQIFPQRAVTPHRFRHQVIVCPPSVCWACHFPSSNSANRHPVYLLPEPGRHYLS